MCRQYVAPVDETLRVDQRIDRLVDERPSESAMAERAPRVRRDGGLEALDAAARGRRLVDRGEIALRRRRGRPRRRAPPWTGSADTARPPRRRRGRRSPAPTPSRSRPPREAARAARDEALARRPPRAPRRPSSCASRRAGLDVRSRTGRRHDASVERRVQRAVEVADRALEAARTRRTRWRRSSRLRWIAQATSRSSAAPRSTRSPPRFETPPARRRRSSSRSLSDVGDEARAVDRQRLERPP